MKLAEGSEKKGAEAVVESKNRESLVSDVRSSCRASGKAENSEKLER
jgi:hypothetical protein